MNCPRPPPAKFSASNYVISTVKSSPLHNIDISGRTLEYEFIPADDRTAPTLVFLHEGLGSAALWKDFPRHLAQVAGCNALIYSRYGYGNSAPLKEPRRPEFMHDEALQVLRLRKVPTPLVAPQPNV